MNADDEQVNAWRTAPFELFTHGFARPEMSGVEPLEQAKVTDEAGIGQLGKVLKLHFALRRHWSVSEPRCRAALRFFPLTVEKRREEPEPIRMDGKPATTLGDAAFAQHEALLASAERADDTVPFLECGSDRSHGVQLAVVALIQTYRDLCSSCLEEVSGFEEINLCLCAMSIPNLSEGFSMYR